MQDTYHCPSLTNLLRHQARTYPGRLRLRLELCVSRTLCLNPPCALRLLDHHLSCKTSIDLHPSDQATLPQRPPDRLSAWASLPTPRPRSTLECLPFKSLPSQRDRNLLMSIRERKRLNRWRMNGSESSFIALETLLSMTRERQPGTRGKAKE
jgi:hypothetical protein